MASLDELLALLPDNDTGAIDAADMRFIVTDLYNRGLLNSTALDMLIPLVSTGRLSADVLDQRFADSAALVSALGSALSAPARTTEYLSVPAISVSTGTAAVFQSICYLTRFIITKPTEVTGVGCYVTTAGNIFDMYFGLYNSDSEGLPLANTRTISGPLPPNVVVGPYFSGFVESQTLTPGSYWVGMYTGAGIAAARFSNIATMPYDYYPTINLATGTETIGGTAPRSGSRLTGPVTWVTSGVFPHVHLRVA